jgi:hypothetical protein
MTPNCKKFKLIKYSNIFRDELLEKMSQDQTSLELEEKQKIQTTTNPAATYLAALPSIQSISDLSNTSTFIPDKGTEIAEGAENLISQGLFLKY